MNTINLINFSPQPSFSITYISFLALNTLAVSYFFSTFNLFLSFFTFLILLASVLVMCSTVQSQIFRIVIVVILAVLVTSSL